MTIEAPKVIVVEDLDGRGRMNLAHNENLAKVVANQATSGEVHEDGKCSTGWSVEKPGKGIYKVMHNWGYFNLALSVNATSSKGIAKVLENHPTYFVIETSIDGELHDLPFVFSLTKVISR